MADIGYQKFDDFSGIGGGDPLPSAPPPSYDDIVTDPQPSAPPGGGPPVEPPTQYYQRAEQPVYQPQAPGSSENSCNKFLQSYVGYSMAYHLRKYMIPKGNRLDPELDVEAQFSRRVVRDAQSRIAKSTRLQCFAGWLWCFGMLQIFLYLLLPIGMLATGIVGALHDDCPYRSNSLIIYLLLGGSLLALLVLGRSLPSILTCFRRAEYLNSKDSSTFTGCICVLEVLFYILASANFVILVLGTVWIFQDTDIDTCTDNESSGDCCKPSIYRASAFFNVFQYVLYGLTALYMCLLAGCVRNMDKVYGSR